MKVSLDEVLDRKSRLPSAEEEEVRDRRETTCLWLVSITALNKVPSAQNKVSVSRSAEISTLGAAAVWL